MIEYDDSTRLYVATFKYDEEPGISFGWFQTELDEVEKKFFYEKDVWLDGGRFCGGFCGVAFRLCLQ
jgi:hypothetical protein